MLALSVATVNVISLAGIGRQMATVGRYSRALVDMRFLTPDSAHWKGSFA